MTRAITCCLLTLGLLGGCAHVPPAADVAIPSIGQPIGQTGFFTLVQASEAITLREMTRRLLGEEDLAELVARANALPVDTIVASGQIIALPRKPIHSSGISPHGIQTVQILCYHRFSLRASSEPMTVSAADFEAQMAYLVNNGYRVIRLAELAGFMEGGTLFPERLVVITIDDGFASVAEVAAPILAKYGLPATLFVYPEFIGGGLALSWDALKALADSGLFDVQSHSTSHTSHARRPQESDEAYRQRLDREIDTASRSLAGHLGRAPSVYAYPYGDTSTDTIHALQARQYRFGVTVRRGGTAAFSHPFTLRRTMIYGHDSLAQFARKLVTRQPLPPGMKPAASLALVLLAGCQAAPRPDHADRDPHVVEFVERQSVLARRQQRDGDFAAAIATWEAVRLVAPDDDRVGRLHQLQTLRRLRIAGLEAQLRATSSAARRRAICLDILALEGGHQGAIDILRAQELRDALHNAAPVPDKPPYRPATAHSGTHAQKHAEQPVMPPRSAPTPDDASLLVAIDRALHKEDLTTAYALFARGAHALAVNGRTVLDRLGTALHAHGRSLLRVDLDQGIVWLRRAIEVLPDNARAESDLRAALRMQKNLKRIRRG